MSEWFTFYSMKYKDSNLMMIWSNLHWWRMCWLLAVKNGKERDKNRQRGDDTQNYWSCQLRGKQFNHRWRQMRGVRMKGSNAVWRKRWWMGVANRFYMESESDGIKNLVWPLSFWVWVIGWMMSFTMLVKNELK